MFNVNFFWRWDIAFFFNSQVTCSDKEKIGENMMVREI